LLTVWPIMPQPAMPPNRLAAALAMPRPVHSRFFVARRVGEIVDDAGRHHRFEQADHGDRERWASAMIFNVSSVSGTNGQPKTGSESGQLAEIGHGQHRQIESVRRWSGAGCRSAATEWRW
jgi:predicted carbohydrate-binding protein with CBM5 and CBM33 domain